MPTKTYYRSWGRKLPTASESVRRDGLQLPNHIRSAQANLVGFGLSTTIPVLATCELHKAKPELYKWCPWIQISLLTPQLYST